MSAPVDALGRLLSGVSFLKQVDLFRDVPADYLVAVAEIAEERTCYAGELLFREGEPGDCLYVIAEGEIRVTAHGTDVARLRAGDVVGEMAVLDARPRSAAAVVAKDGRVLRIASQEFRLLLLHHPEIAMALLRTLSRRLRTTVPAGGVTLEGGITTLALKAEDFARPVPLAPLPAALARPQGPVVDVAEDRLLGGRYRVKSRLAPGRWAADDVELGEPVAVELVPQDVSVNAAAFERLRKRLAAARRLSHRNVQRAFDLFHDGDLGFVTLELVQGPALEERIRQAGGLPFEEAFAIAGELAAGLAALEEAGVPCGTLASPSIVLVPESKSAEGTRRWRPVLATTLDESAAAGAADVATFGHLIEEMMGGKGRAPDSRWDPVLKRCLDADPAKRFHTFAELASALEGEERTSTARRVGGAVGLAAAALAAGLLIGQLFRVRPPANPESAAEALAPARKSVAVLALTNASGDPKKAWLATAFSEMLVSELAAGDKVRLLPSDEVARAARELGGAPEALRKRLAADYFVDGSYTATGDSLHLDLRLKDAATGKEIAAVADDGAPDRVFELASSLGARLRYELRLGDLSRREADSVRAALPVNEKAAQLYAEGLDSLRRYEAATARVRLEKAVAEDPLHALAHAALARAYQALGYDEKARASARKAQDLSLDLLRGDQLVIEARYRELIGERDRAIEVYGKLREAQPDDPEPALALVSALVANGKAKDALPTIAALRLTKAGAVDPRVDLAEADVARALGNYRGQADAAIRAAATATAQGSPAVVARARFLEGNAYRRLKDGKQARAALEDARVLYLKAGDRGSAARSLIELAGIAMDNRAAGESGRMQRDALDVFREIEDQGGMVDALVDLSWTLRAEGDAAASKKAAVQAQSIAREVGDARLQLRAGNAVANAFWTEGDGASALRTYEEGLALCLRIGDKGSAVTLYNNVALIQSQQGKLDEAVKGYEASIAMAREVGEKRMLPQTLMNLSLIELARGRLERARALNEESEKICRETGNNRVLAYAVMGLSGVNLQQGRLDAARKNLEEAIALQRGIGDPSAAALTEVYLAEIAIGEGKPAEAAAAARASAAMFEKERRPLEATLSRGVAARALLELGDVKGAAGEIERTRGVETTAEIKLGLRVVTERIKGLSGGASDARAAIQALDALVPEAAKVDVSIVYEARLAAAALEKGAAARAERLATITKDARAGGFERYVKLAEKLR